MMNYDEIPINDLVKAVKAGDDDACGALLRRYAPLVDSLVYNTMPFLSSASRTDEDELRQEAIIKLYQSALAYDETQNDTSFGLFAESTLAVFLPIFSAFTLFASTLSTIFLKRRALQE